MRRTLCICAGWLGGFCGNTHAEDDDAYWWGWSSPMWGGPLQPPPKPALRKAVPPVDMPISPAPRQNSGCVFSPQTAPQRQDLKRTSVGLREFSDQRLAAVPPPQPHANQFPQPISRSRPPSFQGRSRQPNLPPHGPQCLILCRARAFGGDPIQHVHAWDAKLPSAWGFGVPSVGPSLRLDCEEKVGKRTGGNSIADKFRVLFFFFARFIFFFFQLFIFS